MCLYLGSTNALPLRRAMDNFSKRGRGTRSLLDETKCSRDAAERVTKHAVSNRDTSERGGHGGGKRSACALLLLLLPISVS